MNDILFKIKRNIFPSIRGFLLQTKYILNNKIVIGKKIRIKARFEHVLHPGCQCTIGNKVIIGKNSTIAVTSMGYLCIADSVGLGDNNQIVCHGNITIGKNTILGPNVLIYDHNHKFNAQLGVNRFEYDVDEVKIGEGCWIGSNCVILKGVHIGNKCIIGAGSIVTKNIPDNSVAVGNPAKVIKTLDDDEL